MLRQLIKIMWHRKGKNFLLLMEIFFSFVVLFATSTLVFESLRNYMTPRGFDYQDVYALSMDWHGEKSSSAIEKIKQIKQEVESMPEVASVSLSSINTPYSNYGMNGVVETTEGGRSAFSNQYYVDPSYFLTLDIELASGRFLEKRDIGKIKPVVINEKLSEQLFLDESPFGKRITYDAQQFEVIGVVKHFRQDGEFSAPVGSLFQLANLEDSTSHIPSSMLIEMKSGTGQGWQPQLVEKLNRIANGWTIEVDSLTEPRADKAKFKLIPIIALSIVCGFLIFNVALGLFGVLWININKRYGEIGIRRALGATKLSIRLQMICEVFILASLGIIAGVVLAVQFPLLGVFNVETNIYILSLTASLLLIYLLVAFCAWYPSRQASYIEPAEALHYE